MKSCMMSAFSSCPLAEHTPAGTLAAPLWNLKLTVQPLTMDRNLPSSSASLLQGAAACAVWVHGQSSWDCPTPLQRCQSCFACGFLSAALSKGAAWLCSCSVHSRRCSWVFVAIYDFILHLIACWQISFCLASNLLYHFGMNNTSLLHLGLDKG